MQSEQKLSDLEDLPSRVKDNITSEFSEEEQDEVCKPTTSIKQLATIEKHLAERQEANIAYRNNIEGMKKRYSKQKKIEFKDSKLETV